MVQSQRLVSAFHSRSTAACDDITSWKGAAGSGASTGAVPQRRIVAGVTSEYPSAPAGQIARPI